MLNKSVCLSVARCSSSQCAVPVQCAASLHRARQCNSVSSICSSVQRGSFSFFLSFFLLLLLLLFFPDPIPMCAMSEGVEWFLISPLPPLPTPLPAAAGPVLSPLTPPPFCWHTLLTSPAGHVRSTPLLSPRPLVPVAGRLPPLLAVPADPEYRTAQHRT